MIFLIDLRVVTACMREQRCLRESIMKSTPFQKHAKTHSNLRPYTCRYCAFAFKTKGNLTKHMKSKAHHKKCVEIGVVPVPTNVEDLAYLSPDANSALSRVSLKLSIRPSASIFCWHFGIPHRFESCDRMIERGEMFKSQ